MRPATNRKWTLWHVVLALSTASAVGCGEAAFSAHSRDNYPDDIRRALGASRRPPQGPQGSKNATGHPMAFLVTTRSSDASHAIATAPTASTKARQLVALDLKTKRTIWTVPADVRSRVVVGKALLFHRQGASEIVGREVGSGQVKLILALGGGEHFMGMATDGERLYYVVQSMASGGRTSTIVAVDGTGRALWRRSTRGSLGTPAARGGVVAVPFAHQNLSLLDGTSGKELGRVRATDEQISFVRALPEGFFYGGQKGIYLLDHKSWNGSQKGSSYFEPRFGSARVRTFLYWDAYQEAQSDYTALDRNRLLWTAEPRDETVAFVDDSAVLHSYRYLFAFDVKGGHLRWAFANPRELVASETFGAQVVYVSADGNVGTLDGRSGAAHLLTQTGLRVLGATFDAAGLEQVAVESGPGDLLGTLQQIVWDPDSRFTAVKIFATDAIGRLPGRAASSALLKIVRASEGVPTAVQKLAGEELVRRKDASAAGLYLEALKVHFDYLENSRPQGVDVLAKIVAALGLKEAVPELCAHLLDHETAQSALPHLAAALGLLGGKQAARALQEFLSDYRSDPMFLLDPSSLTASAEALLKIGGPEGRRNVVFVARDGKTLPTLAKALKILVARDKPSADLKK